MLQERARAGAARLGDDGLEDLRPQCAGWQVRLHEKGGKQHAVPCRHVLAEASHAYIDAAGRSDSMRTMVEAGSKCASAK